MERGGVKLSFDTKITTKLIKNILAIFVLLYEICPSHWWSQDLQMDLDLRFE